MDGPVEVKTVFIGGLHQVGDIGCFLGGIRQAPVGRRVVGVVLRTVDVVVHLIAAQVIDDVLAHLVAPGRAVETFHHSAVGKGGIVVDFHHGQTAFGFGHGAFQHLAQRLESVECSALVEGIDSDFLVPMLRA